MKKIIFIFIISVLSIFQLSAQSLTVFEFEDLSTDTNQHQILSVNNLIEYINGYFQFPAVWDTSFGGFWSNGWLWSSHTDSVTPGFTNQYSSANGKGADGSDTYLVQYSNSKIIINNYQIVCAGYGLYSAKLNNSTYAYQSMLNGDGFAKKFGGVTGNDPDYFVVTFYGYYNGIKDMDSVNFYLADFRDSNPTNDYIIKDWTTVDLTPIGYNDSILIQLRSSDNGAFGMNTPAYFCMDNLVIESITDINEKLASNLASIKNNIVNNSLEIQSKYNATYRIIDSQGRLLDIHTNNGDCAIDVSQYNSGIYMLQCQTKNQIQNIKWIKI